MFHILKQKSPKFLRDKMRSQTAKFLFKRYLPQKKSAVCLAAYCCAALRVNFLKIFSDAICTYK